MHISKDRIINRINELLSGSMSPDEVYFGAVTLVEMIYGKNSPQERHLFEMKDAIMATSYSLQRQQNELAKSTVGVLKSIRSEVEGELLSKLQKQYSGELYGDFITMSRRVIEDGYKDVSAVLASAALEDALKRLAKLNELNVDDSDMSEVINALKSKSILKGPQATIVKSYVQIRNKAFHADWDKIDIADVKSLIAFTEEFILKNFT